MKKVFSTFQTCALGFELKELLRKRVKYLNPMEVTKFENKLYESGLSLQGTSQIQVLEVLTVYIKPRKACNEWFWNVRFSSGRLIRRACGLCVSVVCYEFLNMGSRSGKSREKKVKVFSGNEEGVLQRAERREGFWSLQKKRASVFEDPSRARVSSEK